MVWSHHATMKLRHEWGTYNAVVLAKKWQGWATHPSVFFISTTCLRACSVLIHTKQRRTP